MTGLERNVCVEGVWYGPDYPDAGSPPSDKVDGKWLGRKVDDEDVEPVGWAAVTTPEQARQFSAGEPVPVVDTDGERREVPEIEPVGSKAVETEEEAATFRGRPTRTVASTTKTPDTSGGRDEPTGDADTGAKPATRPRSK